MIGRPRTSLRPAVASEYDVVKVDGKKIHLGARHVYILLNKPKNVMSTSSDPEGRPTVVEYLQPRVKERLYPVGRLDFGSEGLIILTNDGEFTKSMTQAGVVPKVYHVKLSGRPLERDISTACGEAFSTIRNSSTPCGNLSASNRGQSLV